jgi:hypothetical protein
MMSLTASVAGGLHRVFEARDLQGAADRQDRGAGLNDLQHALFREAQGHMVGHEAVQPHAPAAATAAEAVLAAAAHLDEFQAGDRLEHVARRSRARADSRRDSDICGPQPKPRPGTLVPSTIWASLCPSPDSMPRPSQSAARA